MEREAEPTHERIRKVKWGNLCLHKFKTEQLQNVCKFKS